MCMSVGGKGMGGQEVGPGHSRVESLGVYLLLGIPSVQYQHAAGLLAVGLEVSPVMRVNTPL
eukprot:12724668-Ditylum_brightwellii.AAC.1